MEHKTRKIAGTVAIAGLLMAGGMAGAQAKDGVEDRIDPLTGAIAVDDHGVHGPGHVDLNDQPDDGDAVAGAPVAAVPEADPAAVPVQNGDDAEAAEEAAEEAEDEAEDAAKDAEDEAKDAADEADIDDDVVPEPPHTEGLDDAPGAPDDGL